MRYNVRHIITTRGGRLVSDHTVETESAEAREYGSSVTGRTEATDMEVRTRDGGVIAYRWSYVGSPEVHTVVFWPLADGSDVGDGYPYGIAATFRMSAVTGEPKKMIHPSGATGSTDETGALDRLLYAVGRACEPLGTFGESKTDERRAAERITAEALVQFAHETGAVTAVDGEQIGGPSRLLQVLIEMCGGYR